MEIDSQYVRTPTEAPETSYTHLSPACPSTRRHTVGPGDVEHEQALAHPSTAPINFKFGPEQGPHYPINLPMLQNQPLHNFTIKNQHLLKPPTAMEASKFARHVQLSIRLVDYGKGILLTLCSLFLFSIAGSFGRRASDGGANLQIFYPASANNVSAVDQMYAANTNDLRIGVDVTQQSRSENMANPLETGDESNDEIQRYISEAF